MNTLPDCEVGHSIRCRPADTLLTDSISTVTEAIPIRLTKTQMSVIWPGLDFLVIEENNRRENKWSRWQYPFQLYPPPAGFDEGVYDANLMRRIEDFRRYLQPKARSGGRVQMDAITIRVAVFAVRAALGLWRLRRVPSKRQTRWTW